MSQQHPPSPSPSPVPAPELDRRLTLPDAVVLGVGSMLGAGVFAVLAPAAGAAGDALLLGLLLAAVVAYANAMSTAQLAAVMPTSGGAYRYGRERLGHAWGYAAGWCFVTGKIASCAAMAVTFAAYVAPAWQRPVAVAAVVALVAVNERGITRTAGVTRVLVAVTSAVLLVVVGLGASALAGAGGPLPARAPGGPGEPGASPYDVLQSAGLLFFAMAGYARIATLGAEVVEPRRVIPRAIAIALGLVLAVYLAVAVVALGVVGAPGLAGSAAPLVDVVVVAGQPGWAWVVRVGAAAACLGALLGLVAGVSRTAFAMAGEGDLPRRLAAVHPRSRVPYRAERAVGAAVVLVVLLADVRTLIGLSSFGVLLYYGIANAAAFTQPREERRLPRAVQVLGMAGCVVLVGTLPPTAVGVGAGVLAVGLAARAGARATGRAAARAGARAGARAVRRR